MNRIRPIVVAVILLISAVGSVAQNLHKLPADKSITRGTLKNGTQYFVVPNKSVKGMADFALVQRTGRNTEPGVSEALAGNAATETLGTLPRLSGRSAQSFAARHGVTTGKDGFVKVTDDATVFRFENLVLSKPEVLDSALLMLLDMVDRVSVSHDNFLRKWYAPSDQALVIAGDVDVKEVVRRLELMSYMTPALPSHERPEYVWNDVKDPVYNVYDDPLRNLATLKLSWRLPRTPKEFMNTVQPVTFESFISEIGIIASDKIKTYLGKRNVSVADVSYEYKNAVSSFSDESFSVSVTVSPDHLADAILAMAHVMSEIDAERITAADVRRAEKIYFEKYRNAEFDSLHDNAEYVDRCVAAFLYNASLTSHKDVMDFHATRAMSDDMRLKLFNSIASALLDRDRNLTVECRMKDNPYSIDDIRELFESVWDNPRTDGQEEGQPDSLRLAGVSGMKLKVKNVKTEHMSGGSIWTLSNGFKIIIKKLPIKDRIFYSMLLNGGYASVDGLESGEGAYLSDFLDCCRIGGLKARDFRDFLREQGMTLNAKVNISNTIFSGQIPDDRMELLLQTLTAVMNDREVDDEAFCIYAFDEALRPEFQKGTIQGRIAAIDSIMCPDYRYSPYKTKGMLAPSFAVKADGFFASQAAKMNDGYLVLVGDVDESQLKKLLLQYAGNFKMTDKAFPRTVVRYQPIAGVSTYTVDGTMDCMDMVMSAPVPLTVHNYYLAEIASMVLKKCIARAVGEMGMYPRISHECKIYPQERYNVMLSLSEAPVEGFAKGTVREAPLEALETVRSVLADMDSLEFSDEELSVYKASLKQSIELKKNDPDFWLAMISRRYLDGKDLYTGYAAEIDSITKEDVKALLSSLSKGSRVEYIVTAK